MGRRSCNNNAGESWLVIDGAVEPIQLGDGDFVILPHGLAYSLASDLNLEPEDYRAVIAGRLPGQILRHNGGGRATIISVAFTVNRRNAEMLLNVLPTVVHLRSDTLRPPPEGSMHQIMQELRDPKPGSRLIVEQLTTMMLAQALRAYLANEAQDRSGWLFALADRQIGASISAMHRDPSYPWTVQELADLAGMGRTSFANRFKGSVGFAPMDYLTRFRMSLARGRLSTSNDAVGLIAQSVGYESESAFSHAFKRDSGCSPRRYATDGMPLLRKA